MGIVVTAAMLLGLIAYVTRALSNRFIGLVRVSAWALGLAGLWNILWYGMRHLETFWGQAAIISGFVMLLAALNLINTRTLLPRSVIFTALLASFLLYAVTLIRLNMGLTIIE